MEEEKRRVRRPSKRRSRERVDNLRTGRKLGEGDEFSRKPFLSSTHNIGQYTSGRDGQHVPSSNSGPMRSRITPSKRDIFHTRHAKHNCEETLPNAFNKIQNQLVSFKGPTTEHAMSLSPRPPSIPSTLPSKSWRNQTLYPFNPSRGYNGIVALPCRPKYSKQ